MSEATQPPYWLYVVKCRDGSLYTGITTDPTRRIKEHNTSQRGAKYTATRRPVRLIYTESHVGKSAALVAEAAFKKLSRTQKFQYIDNSQANLSPA